MKKEDLLKAVGGADDRFIAEAAPKKINFKNRAPRYPMRLMTAAACLCIVAAVFFGYWLISPARLQKISLGTVGFSGEGAAKADGGGEGLSAAWSRVFLGPGEAAAIAR